MRHLNIKSRFLILLLGLLTLSISQAWGDDLISAAASITDGNYYIVASYNSKYYAVPNSTINGQTFTCVEGTYSNNVYTAGTNACAFQFESVSGVTNAFYIYNPDLKKYLTSSGDKKFGYSDNKSGYWTFSGTSSLSASYSIQQSSKTQHMRAYNNSIRCYNSTANSTFYLMKAASTKTTVFLNTKKCLIYVS